MGHRGFLQTDQTGIKNQNLYWYDTQCCVNSGLDSYDLNLIVEVSPEQSQTQVASIQFSGHVENALIFKNKCEGMA